MPLTKAQLEHKITKARVQLILDHPFFGALACRVPSEVTEHCGPTAETNGKWIHWNPAFLESLSEAEVKGVYAHEVCHIAYGHCWRRASRHPIAWNIAGDLAINSILQVSNLPLPKGALYPQKGDEFKSAEKYYSDIPVIKINVSGAGKGKGAGPGDPNPDPGGCGGVIDLPGSEDTHEAEQEWKVAVSQAASIAKSQGKLPAELQRFVDEIVDPKIPWYTVLRDFVERTAKNDFNWTIPNRRYIGMGVILPSLISEQLPDIVIVVDTSGSIGQKEMDVFAAEVSGVLQAYNTTIHIVYADAAVAGTEIVERGDLPIKLKPKGGGGTDFRPAFEWIKKSGILPACTIYLTDCCGTFPDKEADHPVLWVCTTDIKAPHGQTVRLN